MTHQGQSSEPVSEEIASPLEAATHMKSDSPISDKLTRDSVGDAVSVVRAGEDGCSLAEQKLYSEFWKRVEGYVRRRMPSSRVIDAEDVTSEVLALFFRVVRNDKARQLSLSNHNSIFAFLAKVAERRTNDKRKWLQAKKRCPPGGVRGDSIAYEDSQGGRVPLGAGGERPAPIKYEDLPPADAEEYLLRYAHELAEIGKLLCTKFSNVLTHDELKVAECQARGMTIKEIAQELNVSTRTVNNRVASMRVKIRKALSKD